MLDRDEVVLQTLGLVLRLGNQVQRAPVQIRRGASGDLGKGLEPIRELALQRLRLRPCTFDEGPADAVTLVQDREQHVLGENLRATMAHRQLQGGAKRLLALRGHSIHIHRAKTSLFRRFPLAEVSSSPRNVCREVGPVEARRMNKPWRPAVTGRSEVVD